MDFERGSEFLSPQAENSESPKGTSFAEAASSYSEKETAKVIEGSQQDIKVQNNRKPIAIKSFSKREKIVSAYKKNLERIVALVETLSTLDGTNHRQEEHIVEEIRHIRHVQEELLNALLLEQKGMLSQESISKEAWNLIQ